MGEIIIAIEITIGSDNLNISAQRIIYPVIPVTAICQLRENKREQTKNERTNKTKQGEKYIDMAWAWGSIDEKIY